MLVGGVGLVAACVALARVPNLVEAPRAFLALYGAAFACYSAAISALARLRGRRAVLAVGVGAALCRLALLPAAPTLSTDAYRYVWDARVASAGIDPYTAAPTDPELARLRETTIFPRLNHPTWATVYPPGAQLFFRAVYAVAPDSVRAMKAAVGLAEIAALMTLASLLRALGLPLVQLAIYAWNPLVLVEIWGSGHLDALVLLAVVAAARLAVAGRVTMAAAALGLGTLGKLYPAILLPLLFEGVVVGPLVAFALVVVAGYALLAPLGIGGLGSLSRYVSTEYFNPGLVRTLVDEPAVTMIALGLWVVIAGLRRGGTLIDRIVVLVAGSIVLSPNVFPWYALWLVPFLSIRPSVAGVAFTGTLALAYAFFLHEPWAIPTWARVAEFLPLAIGLAWAARRMRAPGATAPAYLTSPPLRGDLR